MPLISRILVADDHHAIRKGVCSVLEGHAYEVVAEASDGLEALRMAQELRPDVAIIDYSMPSMNGLQLARRIRSDLPNTEVLVYTMHDREAILLDILRAGARGYVLKSDHVSELLAAVAALAQHEPYFSSAITEILVANYLKDLLEARERVNLTDRERQIVQLIAEGKFNKEVAKLLNVSVKTVETHRSAAMHKLNLTSTAELVMYAVRNVIVEP